MPATLIDPCKMCWPHTLYEKFDQADKAAGRIERADPVRVACVVGQCATCKYWYILVTSLPLDPG